MDQLGKKSTIQNGNSSLWGVGHAQRGQVAITEGEQGVDGHEGGVVAEDDDEPRVLHIAKHEQRHEEHAGRHGCREQGAVLGGLRKGRSRSPKNVREGGRCVFTMQAGTHLPSAAERGRCGQPSP